jgi:AraC-like DNA-binding protein
MLSHLDKPVVIGHEASDILPWSDIRQLLHRRGSLAFLSFRSQVATWCLKALDSASGPAIPATGFDSDPALARVHRHIQRYYLERPSLEQLADLTDWSPGHLHKRFRKAYGHSPLTAVRHYLMNDVLEALRTTNQSLETIAEALGFSDRFHLSKAIKGYFGLSATELRQAH